MIPTPRMVLVVCVQTRARWAFVEVDRLKGRTPAVFTHERFGQGGNIKQVGPYTPVDFQLRRPLIPNPKFPRR